MRDAMLILSSNLNNLIFIPRTTNKACDISELMDNPVEEMTQNINVKIIIIYSNSLNGRHLHESTTYFPLK